VEEKYIRFKGSTQQILLNARKLTRLSIQYGFINNWGAIMRIKQSEMRYTIVLLV
jgi:hypothetical protein